MNIVYVPLARKTFFLESAEENLKKSKAMLKKLFPSIMMPEDLLYETSEVSDYLDKAGTPDLIIYQCATFIGSEFMYEVLRRYNCPICIWAVREPSMDGGRLKLNSLTGAFSAGSSVYRRQQPYAFIFGNPDETAVQQKLQALGKALSLKEKLRNLTVGVIGSQPAGFGFGAVDESELVGKLGTRISHIEAAAIMAKARSYAKEELTAAKEELQKTTKGWDKVPAENLEKYLRLRKAFSDYVKDNGVGAIASRCWPDFFTGFGAPVCGVLSMLNDQGIPSSCETDVGGAITMFMASALLDKAAVYFGDPVAVDTKNDAIVYWHCGAGAPSLASKDKGACLGVHPNRKIGPTMEFGLKEGPVTVLRLGHDSEGYRLYVMRGQALAEPQKFFGTSVTVRPEGGKAEEKVAASVTDGWEPHYVVAYGDITEALAYWSKFMNIRMVNY